MIQLPLFDELKPQTLTPEERTQMQLVEIQRFLHVWNEAERARRLSACTDISPAARVCRPSASRV